MRRRGTGVLAGESERHMNSGIRVRGWTGLYICEPGALRPETRVELACTGGKQVVKWLHLLMCALPNEKAASPLADVEGEGVQIGQQT